MRKERNIVIQIGKKKSGKTDYCKDVLRKVDRALVIDISNDYYNYRDASANFINLNGKGVRRIGFENYMSLETMINICLDVIRAFSNGLIIIEDMPRLFDFTKPLPINFIGEITTLRSKDIDLILNVDCYRHAFHPKILENTRFFNVYKTVDSVERYGDRLCKSCYNLFVEANEKLKSNKKIKSIMIDAECMELTEILKK